MLLDLCDCNVDFTELVSLINENPGKLVHCSRIRAMFASRACHKATRIGDSLTRKQMKTVCCTFI